mmetsp:Transcript_30883/g.91769  ORF Transcript_30883/g.91769 Transcript_30883/m.91769 type:complete len:255 (-) Transcript_30883:232-996(-)
MPARCSPPSLGSCRACWLSSPSGGCGRSRGGRSHGARCWSLHLCCRRRGSWLRKRGSLLDQRWQLLLLRQLLRAALKTLQALDEQRLHPGHLCAGIPPVHPPQDRCGRCEFLPRLLQSTLAPQGRGLLIKLHTQSKLVAPHRCHPRLFLRLASLLLLGPGLGLCLGLLAIPPLPLRSHRGLSLLTLTTFPLSNCGCLLRGGNRLGRLAVPLLTLRGRRGRFILLRRQPSPHLSHLPGPRLVLESHADLALSAGG